MKPGRVIISAIILLVLLGSIVVPGARAQGTPAITFHIYNSHLMTVPDDAEGTIVVDGTLITDQNGFGAFLVENICEGTGCTSQDIYYKVDLAISWSSDWGHDYPTWNVAPTPIYYIGGTEAYLDQVNLGYCGGPTGETGSCTYNFEGTIPASDISEDPEDPHEMFSLAYWADYGGLDITAAYSITLSTSPILEVQAPCTGQYNVGASLGSITLNATDSVGKIFGLYGNTPAFGDYFVIQVTGAWKNNGAGPDLRAVGMRYGVYNTWYQLDDISAECTNGDTYYLQNNPRSIYFRVYDTDGNFASNTGSVTLTIFAVTARTRYPSGCELLYETGEFIEQKTVSGNFPNGQPLASNWYKPWNPNAVGGDSGGEDKLYSRYYMLETIGGPVTISPSLLSYDFEIGTRESETAKVPDTWYDINSAPFITCWKYMDMVGHMKIYFAMDEQISKTEFQQYFYGFRVQDPGSYTDNSGTLGYRLYQATYMQMTTPGNAPDADGCALYNHETSAEQSITIQGNSSSGTLISALTHNAIYAFTVTGGPWKDNGANNYTVELSDDNGNTWTDIEDLPGLLCASSADGNHTTIYLNAAAGQIWRARANDGDSNFANNTLTIGMSVYAGLSTIDLFPSCEDDYNLSKTSLSSEQRRIPGNDAAGKELAGSILGATGKLVQGAIYAIEVTDESKWYEAGVGTGSYMLDISDDGGTTWTHLEDYSDLCPTQLGNGDRYKIFFTAQSSNYKLRVRDGDSNFLNNTGWVMYNLYLGTNIVNPSGPGSTGNPPPEWVVACNESYSRPDSFISWLSVSIAGVSASFPVPRVGDWLEYLRNSITFFFAWCPQHTEALQSIGQSFEDREPLASIRDLLNFFDSIKVMIEGAQATGGDELTDGMTVQEPELFSDTEYINSASGGDTYKIPSAAGPWDLFTIGGVDTETSIWFGGQLDLTSSIGTTNLAVADAYRAKCVTKFEPLFGIVTNTYCRVMATMRLTKVLTWILLVLDFILIFWLILKWLPSYLRRLWNLINGNRSMVGKIAGGL